MEPMVTSPKMDCTATGSAGSTWLRQPWLPECEPRRRGRPKDSGNPAKVQRNAEIAGLFRQGHTLGELATAFNLTRQRIHQILQKAGVNTRQGGRTLKIEAANRAQQQRLDDAYIAKWGHSRAQHQMLRSLGKGTSPKSPIAAYRFQKANVMTHLGREVWQLTLADWWKCWLASGKWARRGRGRGKFCLTRIDVSKPFTPGNIRVVEFTDAIVLGRGQQRRHT